MTDHEKAFFETEPDDHMAEQSLRQDAMRTKMAKYALAGIIGAMAGAVGTSAYFITRPLTTPESRLNEGTCPPPLKPSEKDIPSQATASIEDAMENPRDISQASAISHPEPVICPEPVAQIECPPPKECTPTACTEQQPEPEKVCPPERICPPIPQAQECPSPKVVEKIIRVKVREVVEKKVPVVKETIRNVVRDPALKGQLGAAYDRIRKLELQNGDLRSKLARERNHRPQTRTK